MATGSIQKRITKNGGIRWRIRWDVTDPVTGERRQPSQTFATKKKAEEELRKRLAEAERGIAAASDQPLGVFLGEWLAITAPSRSPSSNHVYATRLRVHLIPALGGIRLDRLRPVDVQRWLTAQNVRYAPQTVAGNLRTLATALNDAVRWHLIPANPAAAAVVTAPRIDRTRPATAWSQSESRRLVAAADAAGIEPAALIRLGLDSGMRIGELFALRWADLDLAGHRVVVQRTQSKDAAGRWLIAERTKTGRVRVLDLNPSTIAALRRHRADQHARRLAHPAWQATDLVFDDGDGTMKPQQRFSALLKRLCGTAGIPVHSPHTLRHTMATIMLEQGVPLRVVQDRLGHTSPAMTFQYQHVLPPAKIVAAEALRSVLDTPPAADDAATGGGAGG